jgi:light-regulated signal transduction histidine kinase (bacteriophytochrome)
MYNIHMRFDDLLRAMHKVCHHDLPNQIAVIQGLLHFLDEESAQLSKEGREYLARLHSATGNAGALARFLREMVKLTDFAPLVETVPLAVLGRELQGELQRRHPERTIEFACHWLAPAVSGDARVLVQALVELFAGLLPATARPCQVQASSERRGEAVELVFRLDDRAAATTQVLDQRLEIVLARAWLALCAAQVDLTLPGPAETRIAIVMPGP